MAEQAQQLGANVRRLEERALREAFLGSTKGLAEAIAGGEEQNPGDGGVASPSPSSFVNLNTAKDGKGRRCVHLAASQGHAPLLRDLITRYGADVDAEDSRGRTALHFAALGGHADALSVLLEVGKAWPDACDGTHDDTPLHLAARTGHGECCDLLMSAGSRGHARNERGLTPAGEAVVHGHLTALEIMASHDKHILLDRPKGFTLLHLACGRGHADVARFLLDEAPQLVKDSGNPERLTPAHCCVMSRSAACLAHVLARTPKGTPKRTNLDAVDVHDRTPADLLWEEPCVSASEEQDGFDEIARLLGDAGKGSKASNASRAPTHASSPSPSVPYLTSLSSQLREAGTHAQQRHVLSRLAGAYPKRTDLQVALRKGLPPSSAEAGERVLSRVTPLVEEVGRLEKAVEVARALKQAHEDEDLQAAFRDPSLRAEVEGARGDREQVRAMLMRRGDGALPAHVRARLQSLQVFFASRGFGARGFAKEVAVPIGKEFAVLADDEKRLDKLETAISKAVKAATREVLEFSQGKPSTAGGGRAPTVPSTADGEVAVAEGTEEAQGGAVTMKSFWKILKQQLLLSMFSLAITILIFWLMGKSTRFGGKPGTVTAPPPESEVQDYQPFDEL